MKNALFVFAVLAAASSASAWYFYLDGLGFGNSHPTYYYQPAPTVIYNPPVYSPYPYYPAYYSPYPYYSYAPAYYYSGTYNTYSYSYDYDYSYHSSGPSTVEHYHYCCSGSSCGWNC
ncbi:Uncharacterised protein [Candidatus Norongarragalina meridionalis]|nr:Uncharacterised protein [Candidatus Norongarragalina meridionalis]